MMKKFVLVKMICFCVSMLVGLNAMADFSFDAVDKMEINFKQELNRQVTDAAKIHPRQKIPQFLVQNDSSTELARINVYVGAFTVLDLKIVEFKIQPYVELRFERQ